MLDMDATGLFSLMQVCNVPAMFVLARAIGVNAGFAATAAVTLPALLIAMMPIALAECGGKLPIRARSREFEPPPRSPRTPRLRSRQANVTARRGQPSDHGGRLSQGCDR
jgi:hypothetical protein